MKRNFAHITIILALSLAYSISTPTMASHSIDRKMITRGIHLEEEESTRKADAEIEDLLINSEIPTPIYNDPALWEVLIRQYGIKLVHSYFSFRTWLVRQYYTIKEVVYENPVIDETT